MTGQIPVPAPLLSFAKYSDRLGFRQTTAHHKADELSRLFVRARHVAPFPALPVFGWYWSLYFANISRCSLITKVQHGDPAGEGVNFHPAEAERPHLRRKLIWLQELSHRVL